MTLTWEDLPKEIQIRNVATTEVEDRLEILESMAKSDITKICFQHTYDEISGFMLDIKTMQSSFRKKAFENGLSQNEKFKSDVKALVQWQMTSWNRLDKLKPERMSLHDSSAGAAAVAQQSSMHDALHTLNTTLEQNNEERDMTTNISKPHFKGDKDSFLHYESYTKNFKTYTRKVKDKVRLLQILRDTLGGDAAKQVAELDLVAEKYDLAWTRLDEVYKKKEECMAQLVDKIFGFHFNVNIDKLDEIFNNYCLLIDKLLTSHDIDLLHDEAGFT